MFRLCLPEFKWLMLFTLCRQKISIYLLWEVYSIICRSARSLVAVVGICRSARSLVAVVIICKSARILVAVVIFDKPICAIFRTTEYVKLECVCVSGKTDYL